MRRLDRYIFHEILGPLGVGFLAYTSLLLINFLFRSTEMIIRRGVPTATVGKLLVFTLPNIVVLTIPMSLLFAILIASGRLASDSELVAMRACGLSLLSLYRPILVLSGFLALVNGVLTVWVLPRGNHALQQLRLDILTQSVSRQVEPRVFYDEWRGTILYVFEMPPGEGRWKGVFIAEANPGMENEVIMAEGGHVEVGGSGTVELHLEEAVSHKVNLWSPERYEIIRHRRLEKTLEDRFSAAERTQIAAAKGLRELTVTELHQSSQDPAADPELRKLARVEIHKKFSIPAACLVFGLFALPLGYNNRRGGKASGFALSVGVIMLYYLLLNNGEEAARIGDLQPWLAMWLPNILLAVVGLFLVARKNRDKSLVLSRLDRWIRERLWGEVLALRHRSEAKKSRRRRSPRPGSRSPDVVLLLPRPDLPFPYLIDRYVLRQFTWVWLLVTLSSMSIYLVADMTETIHQASQNGVHAGVVTDYYKYLSLQIFYEICPVIVLLTTLITFSLFSRQNEITACKASGLSLYRLSVPAIVAAGGLVILVTFLQSEVLPFSNQRAAQLKDLIEGRESVRTYRRADRQWVFGQNRFIYNYLHYDERRQVLQRPQIFEFDDDRNIVRRLVGRSARYAGGDSWIFIDSWWRSFRHSDGEITVPEFRSVPGEVLVHLPVTPDYFDSDIRPPEQMRYTELKGYVRDLKESGQQVPELEVELHNKLSYPVISLVMCLVALPFAFHLGRHGALYGIGLSVVLGMVFMATFALFTTLGEAGALPPAVAVWSPNLLFALLSGYLFLGVRT